MATFSRLTKPAGTPHRLAPGRRAARPGARFVASESAGTLAPLSVPFGVHPKLRVGDVNDPLEREADAIADQVMRMPAPSMTGGAADASLEPSGDEATLHRKCAACSEEDELMRKPKAGGEAAGGHAGGATSGDYAQRLDAARGRGGRPLDTSARSFLEPRLDANLGSLRVHTDASAHDLATNIGARAFTYGRDLFFAAGEYRPGSSEGMRLLSHEVAHTLQGRSR